VTNGWASLPHKSGSHDASASDLYPNLDAGPADAAAGLFALAPWIAPHLLDRLLMTLLMIFRDGARLRMYAGRLVARHHDEAARRGTKWWW
jgi:hypothetical protein